MLHIAKIINTRKILFIMITTLVIGVGIFTYVNSRAAPVVAMTPPPAIVEVHMIQKQNVTIWSSFSGRMRAVDYAEIRPEVSGRITEIRFKDGDTVKAGDVLMVIDPKPYEATVVKAEATLISAKSKAEYAKKEFERASSLVKSQSIAQHLYDQSANDDRVAQSDIKAAEAELKQANINLDHAYVKAPISGRVSRAEITLGNLVQAEVNAPILTTIVSNDGIYADFDVDEQTYLKSIRSNTATRHQEQSLLIELSIQGDENHIYKGTIYSFDNHIDVNSGTIRARAKFANEDNSLIPGMFVSVKLMINNLENVLLVPERAIGNDQNKKYVYIVGEGNKVVYRKVTLGQQARDGMRIIVSGLNPGELVIVDGLQHVQPDATVQIKENIIKAARSLNVATGNKN